MNIFNAIKEGSKILKKNNIKFSALDCEILLAKVLKKERKYLILNLDKKLNRKNLEIFKDLISQRSNGKPIAYLTKKKDFWNSEWLGPSIDRTLACFTESYHNAPIQD